MLNKVILVDDEQFVRIGLKNLINWEDCGYEVCAEADNGEGALQKIEEYEPDVVITDIRMPVLDGLELIRSVIEEKRLNTKFIILSGYSDFKYAQKAVRYGVYDFILKPIEKEELEDTLKQLATTLKEEKVMKQNNEKVQISTKLEELISGKSEYVHDFHDILQSQKASCFYYLIVEVNTASLEEEEDIWFQNEQIKIEHVIGELLSDKIPLPIRNHQRHSYGMVISDALFYRCMNSLDIFIEKLQELLERRLEKAISLYIGQRVENLENVSISFETANVTMQYKYTILNHRPLFFKDIEEKAINHTEMETSIYHTLLAAIEENNQGEALSAVDIMFEEFQSKLFAPEAIKTSINRCIHSVIKTIRSMEGDESELTKLPFMLRWHHYSLTFEQLKEMFIHFVVETSNYLIELRKQNGKGDIQKVKKYIEANFHKNISLKSIATQFFMNPVYMGQLFKKAYGMYFKEYLLEVRIEEAKRLLRQTNLRVYEIAEKVGFQSPDYFVTQFEKIKKMTPTEYRNQILKESDTK
ncbi:response regulator transcription factor [Halalkalibacter sp. APA_J-10(15)]|uniref:response regulator transcription factor n=1 Tax=unclassified Halalkalibacter TaxID=2893063 RepID=UPI001FF41D56|nr:response regulator transcription factor [Halalkalibacter sp. APA_J-10(15)]MCK0473146.1 response regulator transcription factor [Halalkalibacter sp. APA_J-10(15)]